MDNQDGGKKKHKETMTSKKKIADRKRDGQRIKTLMAIYLIPSSVFPRSLYKFQTMTPIFRSH